MITSANLFSLNTDFKTRDKLLFGDYRSDRYYGGIAEFNGVDSGILARLLKENFASPDERQNNAPSTREFLDFITCYPVFRAYGYAVSPDRADYRITLEGVKACRPLKREEKAAFTGQFLNADIFEPENGYCWYD